MTKNTPHNEDYDLTHIVSGEDIQKEHGVNPIHFIQYMRNGSAVIAWAPKFEKKSIMHSFLEFPKPSVIFYNAGAGIKTIRKVEYKHVEKIKSLTERMGFLRWCTEEFEACWNDQMTWDDEPVTPVKKNEEGITLEITVIDHRPERRLVFRYCNDIKKASASTNRYLNQYYFQSTTCLLKPDELIRQYREIP